MAGPTGGDGSPHSEFGEALERMAKKVGHRLERRIILNRFLFYGGLILFGIVLPFLGIYMILAK